jgi:hypothetical protein
MGAYGKGKPGSASRSPHERAINGVVGVSRERKLHVKEGF